MRLFIAIQLSGKMKEALLDMQGQLRRLGVRGNYTPPENLHLTLAFIGEYPGPDSIADVLETIDFRPFELRDVYKRQIVFRTTGKLLTHNLSPSNLVTKHLFHGKRCV